jgi:N-acyl-D-aspartate/D-glutamate deacylase
LSLVALSDCAPSAPSFDLVVRGGAVMDGSGAPAFRADVAVAGGRIVSVGTVPEAARARTVIDAANLAVAPGFVDMHSHADLIALADAATQRRLLANKLLQGVTTLVVGNCGLGVAPSDEVSADALAGINGWMTPEGVTAGPMSVGAYLDRLESGGVVLNVATLVPHGALRASVMGFAHDTPDDDEVRRMRAALALALDEGAFGLSAGLIYPPGMYAATGELVELGREVSLRDGLFACHVRGSSETLIPATRELIEIGRATGARAHHSHLEAVGEAFWSEIGAVLAMEDAARADGVRLSHDVFPYTRAATMMAAIFPPWSLEGGIPALIDRLEDPALRERIRDDIEGTSPEWPPWVPGGWPHNLVGAVGWDGIIVASVPQGGPSEWVGRDLAAISAQVGRDPFDVVADLMIAHGGRIGQQVDEISGRGEAPDGLLAILGHSAAGVVSDAEDFGRGSPHPAHAGSFARVLRLARERGLMTVEEAVRRMTAVPASVVGLPGTGAIREGAPADMVVFDPGATADRATWDSPRLPASGVRWVVVSGVVVVDRGALTDARPAGRVLRAPPLEPDSRRGAK